MLHHRFPNGFTDLFMDETDREVSTLTDRAFRSLCVGDDAVYNDEFLYGYSPFSCHKPLVGEPHKKTQHKESKKQGQNKHDKSYAQPWKQQQQKSISHMSSFLKALSAAEESCEGMLIKNGGIMDSKGESWDKSALRSIQRELSEFSSDYHANLTDGHYKNHHSGSSSSNKNAALPSGKSSKVKNGKSTVKLKKLNIKNFFLHSEFSPFQSWRDLNQFPFGQQDTVLPSDHIPKWYDLPFYKELTEAHRKETLHEEEAQPCQKVAVEPPPPIAPKPNPPSPPPKVLPKPSALPIEKRCSSDVGEGSAAPWRRNRSRAKSVIPVNQPGMPPQGKTVDESVVTVVKQEAKAFEVKAVEEASSVASTPFSICQLMTPLIPSRQPTETSEILQGVFSPSTLDLPLRPHSEAKVTPEPPVKRDNYKSLASSILFNLKDNRKRVKSRYSPPKFKTSEVPGGGAQSPHSDYMKHAQTGSEGCASGLSTPAVLKDGQTVCSPVLESISLESKHNTDRPLSDDYLLTNLLQSKKETGDSNPISPLIHSKKNKSPMAKKQNYPSLNLYKKTSPIDSDMKYLQVPQSSDAAGPRDQPEEANELSPLTLNKALSPKALPASTGISPSTLNIVKDRSPIISPHVLDKEEISTTPSVQKRSPNLPDKAAKQPAKGIQEKCSGAQPVTAKEKDTSGLPMSTLDVIRAAREAINAAKNKALSETHPDSINKVTSEREEHRENNRDKKDPYSKELFSGKEENSVTENNNISSQNEEPTVVQTGKKGNTKKEPPPVPKRNFAKSDIQFSLEKQQVDKISNGDLINQDLPPSDNEPVQKQNKHKHIFSTRQNNYIKYQRHSATEEEQMEQSEEGNQKVNTGLETDEDKSGLREMRDSEHIIHDLHALKEQVRAKLGDRVLDNARSKFGVVSIDEETRAKNDLISRELRNIKKGMLSMRGNTSAKREIFANKVKEQQKQDTFSKVDGNVIVNKTLLNDNYDKAKMALEEIISERQKRKNKPTEHDANPEVDEKDTNESYVERLEQRKRKDSVTEAKKKQHGGTKENDVKERLGDLRDHTHMRQIMSQTEPGLTEAHSLGGKRAGKELNTPLKSRAKYLDEKTTDSQSYQSEERSFMKQISEDSGENVMSPNEDMKGDAPPVPPRNKKGSISKDTDSLKDEALEDIFSKVVTGGNNEERSREMKKTASEKLEANSNQSTHESLLTHSETRIDKGKSNMVNKANSKSFTVSEQSENKLCFSPKTEGNETKAYSSGADLSTTAEVVSENCANRVPGTGKLKRRAPLRPDHLNTSDGNVTNNLEAEAPGKTNRAVEEMHVDAEARSETPRSIISPLLLVNGVSICQSPPDQASESSKSSYFSVESALQRNMETESNVYHSLENLISEVDEADDTSQAMSPDVKLDSDRAEAEFFSLSDHESEPEVPTHPIKSPQEKTEVQCKDSKDGENASVHSDETSLTMSPTNAFSPPLGIPALFKVKDNTFINRSKRNVQPWSPRGSISGSERGEEELHEIKEAPELPPITEPTTTSSEATQDQEEVFTPKKISTNASLPLLQSPSNLQNESSKKPQFSGLLTVPQEEDRYSGISPSSEGVESLPTSSADAAEELGVNIGLPVECEVLKVPSERSGSTCSGNDSQSGLPKPPAVLPKSQKAVLKAMKLTTRRIKKEEAQKTPHKSSSSSSKQRAEKHKSDKPEHKSSSSGSRSSRTSEKKHRDRSEDGHSHSESHGRHQDSHSKLLERGHSTGSHRERSDTRRTTRRQSHDPVESTSQNNEAPPERKGRSSNRPVRDKPEQRPFSSDRVISNVPVYKAHVNENSASDRPFNRSQSIDRYLERRPSADRVERRPSADMSVAENLDSRTQRIEKSIMDELQQRGRARDKAGRENVVRRSHSIDAYSAEAPHPSNLSRQSSHTSQLSRQSSIEHPTIVTQSFPMTQRKLLQDPDSGQYFFVDMPVQVKTKTFFDPETGSYVQLPVQPPEGAVPQASPMEVLTPPMVVYHGFVPVPLSPMAQKATIQASHMAPEEFEQRHLERSGQMHCKERHPYLEPIYAQHDHVLGEFLGTEEVDCPS